MGYDFKDIRRRLSLRFICGGGIGDKYYSGGIDLEEAKIIINTIMTKEDYRRFLYIATFKRNKMIIPMLGLITFVGSLIISFDEWGLNLTKLIIGWVFLFGLAIGAIRYKVERRNARRIKTDKTGAFDSVNTIKFFEHSC